MFFKNSLKKNNLFNLSLMKDYSILHIKPIAGYTGVLTILVYLGVVTQAQNDAKKFKFF